MMEKMSSATVNLVSVPAPCVILAIADVIFEVHLDLIAETLDPIYISQTSCVRIKEHNRLQILLCSCATP